MDRLLQAFRVEPRGGSESFCARRLGGGNGRFEGAAVGIYLVIFWLVGYRAKLHNRSTPWCFCRSAAGKMGKGRYQAKNSVAGGSGFAHVTPPNQAPTAARRSVPCCVARQLQLCKYSAGTLQQLSTFCTAPKGTPDRLGHPPNDKRTNQIQSFGLQFPCFTKPFPLCCPMLCRLCYRSLGAVKSRSSLTALYNYGREAKLPSATLKLHQPPSGGRPCA